MPQLVGKIHMVETNQVKQETPHFQHAFRDSYNTAVPILQEYRDQFRKYRDQFRKLVTVPPTHRQQISMLKTIPHKVDSFTEIIHAIMIVTCRHG